MSEENINPDFAGPAFSVEDWRLAYRGTPMLFDPRLRPDEYFFAAVPDGQIFQILWDNHPGDLERWADDGGREPQGES